MPPLINLMCRTFYRIGPRIGIILLLAFWAIPAGWTTHTILEEPGIVPESGPHLNTVPLTIPECWQPNNAIAQPTRIIGKSTNGSPIKCYVHGLSPISVPTLEESSTDTDQPDGKSGTYISIDINRSTGGRTEARSFIIYTDIDILFESGGATTITVTAEVDGVSPFNTNTTLPITVSGSGVASAVDFAPVTNFDIVVLSGATSGSATFILTPENDLVDETDETITVASTSSLVNGTDEISLLDDDAAPTGISLDATPNVAHENGGPEIFTVTATVDGQTTYATAQSIPITVTGTLVAGAVDFTPVPDFSIEIPAEGRSGSATFTLTPVNDSVSETDETITIASSNTAVTNAINFLLRDDDTAPRGINILTNTSAIYEDLGAQDIEVTLEVSGSTTYTTDQTVPITVMGTGAAGVVGFDPVADFSIVLPAQALTASSTLTITPVNNSLDEANETITLASSSPEVTGPATINLVDDDPTPAITLYATPATISEADGATQVTITAGWTGQVVFPIDQTIPLSITGSGTDAAVDFTSVTDLNLRIAAGANDGTATFTLTPVDDSEDEVDEVITISSTSSLVSTSATITLTDDDASPTISLAVNPSNIAESDGATVISLTASIDGLTTFAESQTIPINVAGSGITAAVDFLPVQDFNITLVAGTNSETATFTLTPLDDSEDETDETITVASTHALVSNSATIVLVDDDATPGIRLSATPSSVREDDGPTEITVTATVDGATTFGAPQILSINVSGSDVPAAVDFAPVADFNLTIDAGSSTGSATFTLIPENDTENELNESITIASTSLLTTNQTTITLIDDDPDQVVLSVVPATVYEDRGTQTVSVTGTLEGFEAFSTDRADTAYYQRKWQPLCSGL